MLDTSSIINGYLPSESAGNYTVPEVVEEARSLLAKAAVGLLLDAGRLSIWEASRPSISIVEGRLKHIGGELSQTDIRVAALALDLKKGDRNPVVLTDDYGLQNVVRVLGIEYSSVGTRGIMSIFEWEGRCPACGRRAGWREGVCPDCGTRLRKVARRRPI